MDIKLNIVTSDELDQLLPLVRQYHELEEIKLTEHEREMAVTPLLGESLFGRIWLISIKGKVIGYIALCFGYSIEFAGRDAFVDEFFIAEPHRGRGYGRFVLEAVCDKAKILGVHALHLEVARINERAMKLYRSVGFTPREKFHLMTYRVSNTAQQIGPIRPYIDI